MIKPLRDFLLIRPHPRSLSDILETPAIVGIDRGRPNMDGRGIAVRVGPGLKVGRKYQRKGLYGPLEIKEGALVAFEDHKAYPKDPTDASLLIMQASDCVVLETETIKEALTKEAHTILMSHTIVPNGTAGLIIGNAPHV